MSWWQRVLHWVGWHGSKRTNDEWEFPTGVVYWTSSCSTCRRCLRYGWSYRNGRKHA